MQTQKKVGRRKSKLISYPTPEMVELFNAILDIRSKDEEINFFRDLLTINELAEFARRWQMVKRLVAGESYVDIACALGVSTATVTRVARWLHNGKGGYKAVASRVFDTRKNPDYHEAPKFKGGKLHGMRVPNQL